MRQPVVEGTFYPADRERLVATLDDFVGPSPGRSTPALVAPVGLMAPHAGYVYSGRTAAAGYRAVAALGRPNTIVILGANHTGLGPILCVDDRSAWSSPLGLAAVDLDLVERLIDGGIAATRAPFDREHSIEVHAPFLQHIWGSEIKIVPLLVQPTDEQRLIDAARLLTECLGKRHSVLFIASSDLTHYEADEIARSNDRRVIDAVLGGDVGAFLSLFQRERHSVCGIGAIALLMALSQTYSLDDIRLVDYSTSGDTTGDRSAVVGYASVAFTRREDG